MAGEAPTDEEAGDQSYKGCRADDGEKMASPDERGEERLRTYIIASGRGRDRSNCQMTHL